MSTPTSTGVHHVVVPVTHVEAAVSWWTRVMGAVRLSNLDHANELGLVFAVIMQMPGNGLMVQLRTDTDLATRTRGYGPVTYGVRDRGALDAWILHLDELEIEHSAVRVAMIGDTFQFASPDGLVIRFYTDAR